MLRRYYGKISKLPINEFFGHDGELVVDDITGKVYVMDGVTLGGTELVGATPQYDINPPAHPTPGTLWYDPTSGRTFIYYQDTWVDAAPNTTYTLPMASADILGGIKVGNNLSIDEHGVLNAEDGNYTLPTASNTVLGGVKVDNATIVIDEYGVISAIGDGYLSDRLVNGSANISISTDGTLTLNHPDEPNYHPLATKLTIQKAAGNYHTISGAYGLSLQATPVPNGYGLNTNTNFVDIFHDGISVNVNGNTWGFNTDGNLTTPSGMTIGSAGFIGEGYGIQGNVDQILSVSSKGIDGVSALLWAETYDEMGGLVSVVSVANDGVNFITGNVSEGVPNFFTFDMDGNLSLPPNSTISAQANDLSLYAEGNVNITSKGHKFIFDTDTVGRFIMPPSGVIAGHGTAGNGLNIFVGNTTTEVGNTWNFGTDGNLTLPESGSINYSNNASILDGFLTSVPTASAVELGVVKVDNSTIVINDGTISSIGSNSVIPPSSTAPVSPTNGQLWYDTVSGKIFVYITDAWVDTSPAIPLAGAAPLTASSAGTPGQIAYDSSHVYICVANNTWKRSELTTW